LEEEVMSIEEANKKHNRFVLKNYIAIGCISRFRVI
jgi:hypothetical protein